MKDFLKRLLKFLLRPIHRFPIKGVVGYYELEITNDSSDTITLEGPKFKAKIDANSSLARLRVDTFLGLSPITVTFSDQSTRTIDLIKCYGFPTESPITWGSTIHSSLMIDKDKDDVWSSMGNLQGDTRQHIIPNKCV